MGLRAQFVPELSQRVDRRAHRALADELVELVGGWGNPVPEEQQRTDLVVERFRVVKSRPKGVDLGLDLSFDAHG
jgi:hypothetical protein